MKYYGDKNIKRGIKLGEIKYCDFDNKDSAVGFIMEHGLFGEYISKMYDEVEDEVGIDVDPENINMNAVEYNGVKYWYGYNCYDAFLTMGIEKKIGVYKELPDIYNDNTFHWRKNRKYDSQECVVEDGLFEYHCIYKADQNGTVDIKYAACDNRHRNKVTIATIDVEYASNIAFNKAIRQWKKQFKESVKSM